MGKMVGAQGSPARFVNREKNSPPPTPGSPVRESLVDILKKIYQVITKKETTRKAVFAEFLKTEVKSMGFSYFSFPLYKLVPVAVECKEWADSQKSCYQTNYDWNGDETFPFMTQIEIAPGKFTVFPVGAFYQIETLKGENLIVGTHHDGDWNYNLEVFSNSQELSNAALNDLLERITKKNIYKNQRIMFVNQDVFFVSEPTKSFEDVVLPSKVLNVFKDNTIKIFENSEKLQALGLQAKRGVLLEGEPGTGKTLLFKALSSHGIGKFTSIFVSSRRYEEDFITHLFRAARDLAPSILFLEDLDMWSNTREGFPGQILGNLLKELDGIEENHEVLICASTNNLEVIDKALKNRPSRFDVILKVEALGVEERKCLLERLITTKLKISSDRLDFMEIAEALGSKTGAEIQEFVFCIAKKFLNCLSNLTTNDCLDLIQSSESKFLSDSKVGFQK